MGDSFSAALARHYVTVGWIACFLNAVGGILIWELAKWLVRYFIPA